MSNAERISSATQASGSATAPATFPESAGQGDRQELPPDVRRQIERWARSATLSHRLVTRSRILLRVIDGESATTVAREIGVSRETVRRWRDRVWREGPDALLRDRPGRGRRPGRSADVVAAVSLAATQHPTWTLRQIASQAGTSLATAQRICRELKAAPVEVDGQLVKRDATPRLSVDGKAIAS